MSPNPPRACHDDSDDDDDNDDEDDNDVGDDDDDDGDDDDNSSQSMPLWSSWGPAIAKFCNPTWTQIMFRFQMMEKN